MTPELKVLLAGLHAQRKLMEHTLAAAQAAELRAERTLQHTREERARAEGALGAINSTLEQLTPEPAPAASTPAKAPESAR